MPAKLIQGEYWQAKIGTIKTNNQMNYLLYFFFNHLPCVIEEKKIVDGREETCLILPVKQNQIKKGKQGNWMMMCRLAECGPNARGQTHCVQLSYLNPEDLKNSYDFGYHKRTAHLGRVYEHDRTPEKKIDRTNNATDIDMRGTIVLSDIPKELIFRNAQNAKRYLSNLVFRATIDNGIVYCGSICVDDIHRDDIETNPETGKKYISTRLYKLPMIDTYFNSHQLVVIRKDGLEVEIGRFKEFHSTNEASNHSAPTNPGADATPRPERPSEINGIKF